MALRYQPTSSSETLLGPDPLTDSWTFDSAINLFSWNMPPDPFFDLGDEDLVSFEPRDGLDGPAFDLSSVCDAPLPTSLKTYANQSSRTRKAMTSHHHLPSPLLRQDRQTCILHQPHRPHRQHSPALNPDSRRQGHLGDVVWQTTVVLAPDATQPNELPTMSSRNATAPT